MLLEQSLAKNESVDKSDDSCAVNNIQDVTSEHDPTQITRHPLAARLKVSRMKTLVEVGDSLFDIYKTHPKKKFFSKAKNLAKLP